MRTWTQLSPDKAHTFYGIPMEVAAVDDNTFFGLEYHPLDLDGPWPLLAFLQDKAHPGVVAFHIFSVMPELLECEGFNPLTDRGGGYLSLQRHELVDLISLLQVYAQRLAETRSNQKMFRKIEVSELVDFRLHPEWFPKSKRYHYYQVYDPLAEMGEALTATIIIFSTGHTGPPQASSNLFFGIASFPLQALQNPSFTPLDDSLARIHLDRSGMQELASLLETQLDHLEGQ